jgi:hypothetical protein
MSDKPPKCPTCSKALWSRREHRAVLVWRRKKYHEGCLPDAFWSDFLSYARRRMGAAEISPKAFIKP